MRPLLWKEMRHVRLWVLSGAALVAALEWMYQSENFRRSFEGAYLPIFMPFLLAVAAIGLGAAQIAGERHARTLDYLRVRPVAPATVVWAKFLAGTIALALLVAALVGLGFVNPIETGDTGIRAIRDQVGFRSVVLTLFPRYWLVYSLTLFFSVLLDRSAKVAAALAALAVAVIGLASYFAEFAPFSGFVYWLPFFDSTGGLVQAAKSGAMIGLTGLVCSGAAVLVTAASAALLNRSPERYLGNRGLVLVAAGLAGAAVISAQLAARWVPVVAPAGSFELSREVDWAGIVARGNTVAVTLDGRVEFLDFSTPSAPKLLRDVTIPLWTTQSDFDIEKSVMAGDTVYLVGHKKAVPVDEAAILMVKTDGSSSAISLGPVRPEEYTSAPVIAGVFLYVGRTQERVCSIHVYELASRQEAAVLVIDRLRPPVPGVNEGQPPVRLCRRGRYLYVTSPSALTTIDIAQASQPVVTGSLEYHPRLSFLYGFPRALTWQDNRLFETDFWPQSLGSFDLSDPAHPAKRNQLTFHTAPFVAPTGSGHDLYLPWRAGVMDARAQANGLVSRRYLHGSGGVRAFATDGGFVYTLSGEDHRQPRHVEAFRVTTEGPAAKIASVR